jgi:hypothetical protein
MLVHDHRGTLLIKIEHVSTHQVVENWAGARRRQDKERDAGGIRGGAEGRGRSGFV